MYSKILVVPIYDFRYRLIVGTSIKEVLDGFKKEGRLTIQASESCWGFVFTDITPDWNTVVVLEQGCERLSILHEAVHVYGDLIRQYGLETEINLKNEENHAYLLSFIQNQLIDAVLEAKKVLSKETKKQAKKRK